MPEFDFKRSGSSIMKGIYTYVSNPNTNTGLQEMEAWCAEEKIVLASMRALTDPSVYVFNAATGDDVNGGYNILNRPPIVGAAGSRMTISTEGNIGFFDRTFTSMSTTSYSNSEFSGSSPGIGRSYVNSSPRPMLSFDMKPTMHKAGTAMGNSTDFYLEGSSSKFYTSANVTLIYLEYRYLGSGARYTVCIRIKNAKIEFFFSNRHAAASDAGYALNFFVNTWGSSSVETKYKLFPAANILSSYSSTTRVIFDTQPSEPPSVPASFIKQPVLNDTHFSREEIQLEWSPSVDPEGDAFTYVLEIYNGTSWNVLQSDLTKPLTTVILPFIVAKNAQLRVKAVDVNSVASGYLVGNTFSIVKNLLLIQDGDNIKTYSNGVWTSI
ncbi:hypothetical protein P4J09_11775 [Bacillus cereus]|nr:hypothetical protein [Bacillus cereus]